MVRSLFTQRRTSPAASALGFKVALALGVLSGPAFAHAETCEQAEAVTSALLEAQVIRNGSEATAGEVVAATLCDAEAAVKPKRKENNKVLGIELENAEPGSKGHERLKRKR